MEDTNKDITSEGEPIHWKVDDPTSNDESKDFWKKLRHFYRTGEKSAVNDEGTLSSALLTLFDDSKLNIPDALSGDEGVSIEPVEETPFVLLNHILTENQKENRKKFKTQLSEVVAGLNDLFRIKDQTSVANELQKTFDFADEMIAFDKMVELIPHNTSGDLTEGRLNRLQSVVETLNTGLSSFNDQVATVVVEKRFADKIQDAGYIGKTQHIEADKDAFKEVQQQVSEQIHAFAELIRAYRIASLEITGDYHEEIQNEYFEHFTWHRLFKEELDLFHRVVLIVEHRYVFDHLTSFSRLLSSNMPVSIIVLNRENISVPNELLSWEDASHQFRQELAALVIAHRNVYMFQGSLDNPTYLRTGLEGCIKSITPGVCHLFIPEEKSASTTSPGLTAIAAKAGRYFTAIKYDPNVGKEWGGRFDLSENLQAETKWPHLILKAKTSEETEAMIDVDFTYADYKAIYPEKAKELVLIPSAYYTEHLVPLSDYLTLDEKLLYGKIPYIWLIDEHKKLHRAAVPNVWVVSCQERLDFWTFLQELGGVNSYYAKEALANKDSEVTKLLENERAKMEAEHQQALTKIQEEALVKATERLISALLELDENELTLNLAAAIAEAPTDKDSNRDAVIHNQEAGDSPPAPPEKPEVTSDAWVESDNCTSCNECTDKFPNIFAYNENKQAFVKDAAKGTFAEIVKAAENCPAACIHPGRPLNAKEPKVDALIKRAAKFN